jgi:hypothetical protein
MTKPRRGKNAEVRHKLGESRCNGGTRVPRTCSL